MIKTAPHKEFHVVIAAAGNGQRFGANIPKQYTKIAGKTVLRHTVDNVLKWPGLVSLHVIIDPKHAQWYHDAILGLDLPVPIHGGSDRKSSVNKALQALPDIKDDNIILVHDAARPCVQWRDVEALLAALGKDEGRAATLATPVTDTLRHVETQDIIDRSGLWSIQTPQGFYFSDLKKAHLNARADIEYTDDTSLVSAFGIEVKLIEGSPSNIKITTKDDLTMAHALLSQQIETRTGLGFDVHAFDADNTNPSRPLVLCGVEVEHDYPLKGHSDADVGLHALTDAILGAIGDGDIGTHFPPSDDQYKNMDSAIFLKHAVELVTKREGTIQNVDLTLICEAPKIAPYQDRMKAQISTITGLSKARISVKATTTERLGFTGRGEGIAAQAIATINLKTQDA